MEVERHQSLMLPCQAAGRGRLRVSHRICVPSKIGLVSPLLAVGTPDGDLHAHGGAAVASGEPFHVRFSTDGAATVSTQDFALAAGGHNGWPAHPGMVIVTLISGSITCYDENCQPTEYKAGDSWV